MALTAAQDGYVVAPMACHRRGQRRLRLHPRGRAPRTGRLARRRLCEKPDVETALRYLAAGDYLWNGGMFFASVDVVIEEFERFEPEMMRAIADLADRPTAEAVHNTNNDPSISIDYAVMERSDKVAVVPARFGWSDVGSWDTIHDFRKPGEDSFHLGAVVEIEGSETYSTPRMAPSRPSACKT